MNPRLGVRNPLGQPILILVDPYVSSHLVAFITMTLMSNDVTTRVDNGTDRNKQLDLWDVHIKWLYEPANPSLSAFFTVRCRWYWMEITMAFNRLWKKNVQIFKPGLGLYTKENASLRHSGKEIWFFFQNGRCLSPQQLAWRNKLRYEKWPTLHEPPQRWLWRKQMALFTSEVIFKLVWMKLYRRTGTHK